MKNELIQHCRYYKGEENNPFVTKNAELAFLWDCEYFWVHAGETNHVDLLKTYLQVYIQVELGLFEIEDSTPITLKALLFNRFCQIQGETKNDAVEPFKIFYKRYYN